MRTYVLQDWTTLTGTSAVTSFKQSDDEWLELTGARDVIFYLHALDGTTAPTQTVYLETSPAADDELFQTLASVGLTGGTAYGKVYQQICLARLATVPPSKFIRWRVGTTAVADWSLTFRVLLSVNFISPDFSVTRGGNEIASFP